MFNVTFNYVNNKLLSLLGPHWEARLNEVALRVVAEVASSLSISKPCITFAELQFVSIALTKEEPHIYQIVVQFLKFSIINCQLSIG